MESLNDIRQKCFVLIVMVGGVAGACEGSWNIHGIMYGFFLGIIAAVVLCLLGGFMGFFFVNALRCARGMKIIDGQSDEGLLLGALFGSLVGIFIQVLISSELHTMPGAAIGTFLGAFIGALPDEVVPVILKMLHPAKES